MVNFENVLGLKNMSVDDINCIMKTSGQMKRQLGSFDKKSIYLKSKTVVAIFYENSTRTRLSFELASKYLGATFANITSSSSSVLKGETLIDTVKTIEMMKPDAIVIRHPSSGAPHLLARNINLPIINAGDGLNEHPTQALLDMFTILEKKGDLRGLKVAIIGDIYHSRVARSNIWGLTKMGSEVRVAGPTTLIPKNVEDMGVKVYSNIRQAIKNADVIIALRIQMERQKRSLIPGTSEYMNLFGINKNMLEEANKDVLVMHPGPVNRGVEISSDLVRGLEFKNTVIDEQVTNGVAVRMALLHLLLDSKAKM